MRAHADTVLDFVPAIPTIFGRNTDEGHLLEEVCAAVSAWCAERSRAVLFCQPLAPLASRRKNCGAGRNITNIVFISFVTTGNSTSALGGHRAPEVGGGTGRTTGLSEDATGGGRGKGKK